MRTRDELLELILDEYNLGDTFGLCAALSKLYLRDIISSEEYSYIKKVLWDNRPDKSIVDTVGYWWPTYDKLSRINFIESLKEKTNEHT